MSVALKRRPAFLPPLLQKETVRKKKGTTRAQRIYRCAVFEGERRRSVARVDVHEPVGGATYPDRQCSLQAVEKSLQIIGLETAANGQRANRCIADDDPGVGVALDFGNRFRQRRAVKNDRAITPGQLTRDLLGAHGYDGVVRRSGRELLSGADGSNGHDGNRGRRLSG